MTIEFDAGTIGLLVLTILSTLELRHLWMYMMGLKEFDERRKWNRNKEDKKKNKEDGKDDKTD